MTDSHKVRIATYGYRAGSGRAETLDEVTHGIRIPWVEIDGHRFDAITHAVIDLGKDDVTSVEVTVAVIGPVELVYVDADGNELGAAPLFDPETGCGATLDGERLDYQTAFGPPDDPAREGG